PRDLSGEVERPRPTEIDLRAAVGLDCHLGAAATADRSARVAGAALGLDATGIPLSDYALRRRAAGRAGRAGGTGRRAAGATARSVAVGTGRDGQQESGHQDGSSLAHRVFSR